MGLLRRRRTRIVVRVVVIVRRARIESMPHGTLSLTARLPAGGGFPPAGALQLKTRR